MAESTATVAQDLQRIAAAASKGEPRDDEPQASLSGAGRLCLGQLELPLAILRPGQLELTLPPE